MKAHWPAGLAQFTPTAPLQLASGAQLEAATVGYQTWGKLNSAGDNAIWVCHALTGTSDVAAWWPDLFGAGRVLDPQRNFIVCANVLGGCYGSAGPLSLKPSTGQTWGGHFPALSIGDLVEHQRSLAEHLGIRKIQLVLGGSMGGFQALEWAIRAGAQVERLALIATGYRQNAQAVALSELQCSVVRQDPKFNNGHYLPGQGPDEGLSLARQIGHLSYRCASELEQRFARTRRDDGGFQVTSYLQHQGAKLVRRFDANCYLRLNDAMNQYDACDGRGEPRIALARVTQPSAVIAIDSDHLYPPSEQARLADLLPNAQLYRANSAYGHDGFLLDAASFEPTLRELLHGVQDASLRRFA